METEKILNSFFKSTFKLMTATLPAGAEFLVSITQVMDLKQVRTTYINN